MWLTHKRNGLARVVKILVLTEGTCPRWCKKDELTQARLEADTFVSKSVVSWWSFDQDEPKGFPLRQAPQDEAQPQRLCGAMVRTDFCAV